MRIASIVGVVSGLFYLNSTSWAAPQPLCEPKPKFLNWKPIPDLDLPNRESRDPRFWAPVNLLLELKIREDGRVFDAAILKSSDAEYNEAVTRWALTWRFTHPTRSCTLQFPVHFKPPK
jgi:TonB family protein